MGPFIDHRISLSIHSPDIIQLIQNTNNIFSRNLGSLINCPAGPIFFNVHNLSNSSVQYTVSIQNVVAQLG